MRPERVAVFAFYVAVFLFLQLWPTVPGPGGYDKVGHVGIYAALVVAGVWAFGSRSRFWVAGVALVLGGVLEFLQGYVSGRSREFGDFVANVVGVALGFVVAWYWRRWPLE